MVHPRSTIDPHFLRHIISSTQISSRICKRLMSAENLGNQPARALDMVDELNAQLDEWKDSLPLNMRPKSCLKQCQTSRDMWSLKETILHSSFYDLVMVLHAPFAYPWITKCFRYETNVHVGANIKTQTAKSLESMADAARSIIVMTRDYDINGANTHA